MGRASQCRVVVTLMVGCLLVGAFAGCAKKGATRENYDKLEIGMSLPEVEAILGEGDKGASIGGAIGEAEGDRAIYVWKDEASSAEITVTFKNGKVTSFVQMGL